MEQKFKMQIQRLVKHAAAVLTAVTVGILSAAAVFSQNSNPVYGAENGIYLAVQIQAIVIRPPVRLKIPAERVRRFWDSP